ncbi:tRNA (uridine(34)/cytosine(34)/5-carboxymethylaminomethyluridine(34)-2'-O)-methyltransferase TrmL [Oceanidesulfovibrio indonesiensis]|jgi:tRNA (cytidine/uridine-2'-O-)-methyltransferase|uniref:Putative tRNA (cytidine(34)-2'-O)-methyltransferase n=1 Tax=Oceanidesulfovibrio indonesiensis TaxID=54767 RepID=A0A7M3MFS7_9BACT|nr:tRNA (cytidine(34)-2'-O)-methyltransferase [Oceanidesulfovibrio indonesiensis]TVM17373.1 tRNA (uridine(34)/cytosine(34)/5-carboxymethylaminomethyluridine(34)-2'-O)-methyltransferase TrmL [Oceanidesulfovibrio indonesiensis]
MPHKPSLVLYEPEIPPNTGNVARLTAGAGVDLHLVEPLGFSLDDKQLKRAGLDYWPRVRLTVWPGWDSLKQHVRDQGCRLVFSTSRSGTSYCDFDYRATDFIVLGPETRGLPEELYAGEPTVRIPITDAVRSLNMSTAAGILLFEALRVSNTMP